MNTTGQANARYNGFDIAKFIMAIFVVTLHAHPLLDISFNLNYAVTNGLTRVAVPYFFMASGFLLFRKMSLYELDIPRIKKYLIHIFRLYIVWTIIYLPIIVYTGILKSDRGILHGAVMVVRNIIMTGSYWQLWFLQALLVAAILVTGLLYFKISIRKIFMLTLFGYMIALIGVQYYTIFDCIFLEGSMGYKAFKALRLIFVTPRNGICFGALYFFMGAYLSQKTCAIPIRRLKQYIAVFFVLLMIEAMGSSFCGLTKISYSHDCYIFLLPLTYYIFLYTKAVKLKDSLIFGYLRKQSMFVFYIHTWWLFLAGIAFGGSKHAFVHLGSMGIYLIALSLSFLSSHIIIVLSKKERFSYLKYLS
jgi:surface polysaccharide O-acyltransferase-like enzyme